MSSQAAAFGGSLLRLRGRVGGHRDTSSTAAGVSTGLKQRSSRRLSASGSRGLYFWGGMAGTTFWVDPQEEMYAVFMAQAPGQRDEVRNLFRNLVYAAIKE